MVRVLPTYYADTLAVLPRSRTGSRLNWQQFLLDFYQSGYDIACLDLQYYTGSISDAITTLRKAIARCDLPVCVARRFNTRIYVWRKELLE